MGTTSVTQEHIMKRIRPRTTVLSGAAFGLIAGAAVYGAVSSASAATPTAFNPAKASANTTPASAASCAAGQELEHGVCIVHVEHSVVAGSESSSGSTPSTGDGHSSSDDSSSSEDHPSGEHHSSGSDHEGDDHGDDSTDDAGS